MEPVHHTQDVSTFANVVNQSLEDQYRVNNSHFKERIRIVANSVGNTWVGGLRGWSHVRELMDLGWKEGGQKLADIYTSIPADALTAKSRVRRPIWSDAGEDLSVDKALRGDFDTAWRTTRREVRVGTAMIDIYASFGGHCGLQAEQLFWPGAAMLVLSEILENAGYRVSLTASMLNKENGHSARHDVVIKDHAEPLRIDALAGILCHAGIFRSLGLLQMCRVPWDVNSGIGHMVDWADMPESLRPPHDAIILDAVTSKDGAIDVIKKALAKGQEGYA